MKIKGKLAALLEEYREAEETDNDGAIRDFIVELLHLSDDLDVDFYYQKEAAREIYLEEFGL